ncbi:PREDICTED: uncharacterized protein At4g15970 [Tarenaya hassleriana]|uniref:uncharacterized protein At4g15970 n=1 Tax=Tarenaya hassleriana TaxID=28532 RepID=UPI00053C3BCC|nr:PREDICTED: uncharacterized protein At4g15970 [Tarenaya hassleriana]
MMKSPCLVIGCLFLVILWLLSHPSCGPYTSRISETRFSYTRPDSSGLSRLLRRTKMEDRTVIVTTVNREWAKPGSLLDLFLESFRIGERTRHLLDHVIVVALDEQALQYCNRVHPHCFLLRDSRRKSAREESSANPDGMVGAWRKKALLKEILELGYNLIFTEADVMWLRNPVKHLHPQHELSVACSSSSGDGQETAADDHGGFFYMKSNEVTILLLKALNMERVLYPASGKQSICDIIKREDVHKAFHLRVTYLDDSNFTGLCQPNAQDLSNISTIHANCCHDTDSKVNNLKLRLEDWRKITVGENGIRGIST